MGLQRHLNVDIVVHTTPRTQSPIIEGFVTLQKEVGLPVKPDTPLMVMVTRLAGHKGLDLNSPS